jgi:hypothetical protein
MTKLSAFWRNHRLGMFYGVLWFVVVTLAFESTGGAKFRAYNFVATNLVSCLITGVIVTAVMRKLLADKKGFLWHALISQALGAFLLGSFIGLITLGTLLWSLVDAKMSGVPGKTIGLALLGEHLAMGPFFVLCSFLSIFTPIFIPMSFLNTWHLWKRVNQPPALPRAACQP